MRIGIQANNIHQGGGAVLLNALLCALPEDAQGFISCDARFVLPLELPARLQAISVKPSLSSRLKNEWHLREMAKKVDVVLCFGNLPPLFRLKAHVVLFVQNRNLVGAKPRDHQLKTRLRHLFERSWLRRLAHQADSVVVQTPSMQRLVASIFPEENVSQCAFVPQVVLTPPAITHVDKAFDYLYVASLDPHKNHRRLIEAWVLMAQENAYPSLALTLSEASNCSLTNWIKQQIHQHALKVTLLDPVPYEQMPSLLQRARAVVYPSLVESFGLPLIEAANAGLPVLAPSLDYVSDVIVPSASLGGASAKEIFEAISQFDLSNSTPGQCDFLTQSAEAFWQKIEDVATR